MRTKSVFLVYQGDVYWDMVLWWFDLRVVVEAGGLAAGEIEEGEGCAEASV